jgi:PBSX family phage terminase large subunit
MAIKIKVSEKFKKLYTLKPDTHTVILIGGRGSGKTYSVSQYIAYQTAINKRRTVIVRDEKALIKESILNEIWERYDSANKHGHLDTECIKNETELKDKKTGETLLYTKGFRASSNAKTAGLKGASNIQIAVIEEAEDIRDPQKYNTFVDSLRTEGCLIIIILNTPDLGFWLIKRYFNATQVTDGYYEITPKDLPGIEVIQASYLDNKYLPPHIISNYEGYGQPGHYLYDPHYYYTAILGYASSGRKGQIFTKVKPITRANYLALQLNEIYGQDFGTAAPAALIGAKFDGNRAYVRLLNYKPLPALELGKLYCTLGFTPNDKIVCDYAEAITISKLANGWDDLHMDDYIKYPQLASGFYAVPCTSKDISARLSLMLGMEIYAVEEDVELWDEINNQVYEQNKYKEYTNDPAPGWDHAFFDAFGYVCVSERGYTQQKAY